MHAHCRRQTLIRICFVGLTSILISTRAMAQHEGDVWIGQTASHRLARGGFDPESQLIYLPPSDGVLHGWADNRPGFDRVLNPLPDRDLYPLDPGADIYLEITAIDRAFRLIDTSFRIYDEPGEAARLGDQNLHTHLIFHINSDDPLFDPDACIYEANFVLRDDGAAQHQTSSPFTMLFTNVAVEPLQGDFDQDRDVDLDDLAALTACLGGPERLPDVSNHPTATCPTECINGFDLDRDLDVDLRDVSLFMEIFDGS